METKARAKAKAEQSSRSPVSPMESPGPRPPIRASEVEGDLGLTSLLGEGEILNVGESQTPESAMSGPCDVTVMAAQAPIQAPVLVSPYGQIEADSANQLLATTDTITLPGPRVHAPLWSTRNPALFSSRGSEPVQIPSLQQDGEARIPTLISSGPVELVKLDDWPPHVSEFDHVKSNISDYCVGDEHDMYWDANVDPYDTRYAVRRQFRTFHAPVPSPTMPNVFHRPRTFRPLDRGHGRMSRGSSCSHKSRPKSRGSSRVASRVSAANFEWVGEFMKKFADDASSREKRLVEEAW